MSEGRPSADLFLLGCGAGFSGDRTDAALPVAEHLARAGAPAAVVFEVLAERTLALAELSRRSGGVGFEPRLRAYLEPVLGLCLERGIRVIGNFGAADPEGAARVVAQMACASGWPGARIAVVEGDDLLADEAGRALLARHAPEAFAAGGPVAAHAYLGAGPLIEALRAGADVVVTGRVADPSLFLAPLVHAFGWSEDAWDALAAGALAGHLLECAAQVTGGYFADPGMLDVPDLHAVGFPVAEVTREGHITVTKPPGTGGRVDRDTVRQQLLYEVHDPAAYVTPDVVLDLTQVEVRESGPDRVEVTGARGRPRPDRLKVLVCHEGDWLGEGEITYAGPNALARARLALDVLRRRLPAGVRARFDLLACSAVFAAEDGSLPGLPGLVPDDPPEVRARLAVSAPTRALAQAAVDEVLALYTCGPAAGGGVRTSVRMRVHTREAFVPREAVRTRVRVVEARHAAE